jgi:hypothetical protein
VWVNFQAIEPQLGDEAGADTIEQWITRRQYDDSSTGISGRRHLCDAAVQWRPDHHTLALKRWKVGEMSLSPR